MYNIKGKKYDGKKQEFIKSRCMNEDVEKKTGLKNQVV